MCVLFVFKMDLALILNERRKKKHQIQTGDRKNTSKVINTKINMKIHRELYFIFVLDCTHEEHKKNASEPENELEMTIKAH